MGVQRKHMLFFMATLILISISFHMMNWRNSIVDKQIKSNSQELPLSTVELLPSGSSRLDPIFAYLTQTEKCLPTHWMANDHLGNSSGCNCHVYVLSYKEPCFQNSSHMFYFHDKSLFWTGGRNLLFFAARKRSYLYYILFDDDIKLIYNHFTPKPFIDKKISPLKIFTDYLLDDLPAAAATAYNVDAPILAVRNKWRNKCKRTDNPKTYSMYHIDAAFNAFHRDTAALLLPYYDKHDKKCVWLSQIFLLFKFQLMFYGRFEYFSFLTTFNTAHRYSYEGLVAHLEDPVIREDVVDAIRQQTPPEYKNHPRFLSMKYYDFKRDYAGVLCVNPPKRRTPIIPYQNMKPIEIF